MATQPKKRIVVIGAAGNMTSVAVRALVQRFPQHDYLLTDYNLEALRTVHGELTHKAAVRLEALDLYQADLLARAVQGADLVILGAGPFHRTAAIVIRACIAARADYLDIDDDVESTREALLLDGEAREAGVGLYIGCGASPGLTSCLAAELINMCQEVESVEVAWVVGDEGQQKMGRAVLEHVLHIFAGDCATWRHGAPFVAQSFVDSKVLPMGGALGDYRLYECAHPETVMLPVSFPHIRDAWCWGGLNPQPVNGLLMGIARAQQAGKLSADEAVTFIQKMMANESGASFKAWFYAFKGMLGQVWRGENTLSNLLKFLWNASRGKHTVTKAAVLARVVGTQKGRRVELIKRQSSSGNGVFSHMGMATGLAQAAFSVAVLQQKERRVGTIFPEKIASYSEITQEIVRFGYPAETEEPVLVREL